MNIKKFLFVFAAALAIGTAIFIAIRITGWGNLPLPTGGTEVQLKGETDEEKLLLNIPRPDSSQELIKAHLEIAQKLATTTDEIHITDCSPKPFVFKTKRGEQIIFANSGEKLILVFGRDFIYTVSTNGTLTIKTEFAGDKSLYFYGCRGEISPDIKGVGFILID